MAGFQLAVDHTCDRPLGYPAASSPPSGLKRTAVAYPGPASTATGMSRYSTKNRAHTRM